MNWLGKIIQLLYCEVTNSTYSFLFITMCAYAVYKLHIIKTTTGSNKLKCALVIIPLCISICSHSNYIFILVFCFIAIIFSNKTIKLGNRLKGICYYTIISIISPIMSLIAQEYIYCSLGNRNGAIVAGDGVTLTIVCYAMVFSLIYLISGSLKTSYIIHSTLILTLFLVNINVYVYRGVSIRLNDIQAGASTLGLLKNYHLTIPDYYLLILAGIFMVWVMILSVKIETGYRNWYDKQLTKRVVPLVSFYISLALIAPYCNPNTLTKLQINPLVFSEDNYGLAINLLSDVIYSRLEKPNGYKYFEDLVTSADKTLKYLPIDTTDLGIKSNTLPKSGVDYVTSFDFLEDVRYKPDHIVIIMRESLGDLSNLKDYTLSEDNIPFMRSLQFEDNTVSGYLCTPVTGGGTANTEFEVLTGGVISLFRDGSYPYQSHINRDIPSIISLAKRNGYKTNSIHTFKYSGYNRERVYRHLGFDKSYWDKDFNNPDMLNGYIKDSNGYELIEKDILSSNEKTFTFFLTMQGHGPWDTWPTESELEQSKEYRRIKAKKVGMNDISLSVLASEHYSADRAFEDFMSYIDSIDEQKILVVAFGDHQACRVNSKGIESNWTPLVVHSNYEMPSNNNLLVSSNYMPLLIAKLANFNTTPNIDLMESLHSIIPIINIKGMFNDKLGFIGDRDISGSGLEYIQDILESNTYSMLYGNYKDFYYNIDK